jgi:hypothetical protein
MLPAIGLMIGMYILTRMIELLMTQDKSQLLPLPVRIFAGITIGVCVLGMLALLGSSSPT